MRNTLLSVVTLAGLALTAGSADARPRYYGGGGYVRPAYGGYYNSYARPYYGGYNSYYSRPYYGGYSSRYYSGYYPGYSYYGRPGFGIGIGSGYYPGYYGGGYRSFRW
jgi:hypothetical protein